MPTKSCPAKIKAAGTTDGLDEGQFEAIVSVFGNKDSYGDVVMPGAFSETLAEWKASGDPIPVLWSHNSQDPDYHVGYVLDAEERPAKDGLPAGLWVKGQLDLDGPKAAQVNRLLKGRRVTQFSFAYDIVEGGWATHDEDEVFELKKLKVYEVGPTLIGANQDTTLIAAKAAAQHLLADVKAGRVISAKNEELLRTAHDSIGAVLSALDIGDDSKNRGKGRGNGNDGTATDRPPVKDEEPAATPSAKSKEPAAETPALDLSVLDALELDIELSA